MKYKSGKISIPNVTGNLVITASVSAIPYDNLADISSDDWKNNTRINGSGEFVSSTASQVSNTIYVSSGDIIRIKNCGNLANAYTAIFADTSATSGSIFNHEHNYDSQTDTLTFEIPTGIFGLMRQQLINANISGEIIITRNEVIAS